MLFNFDNKYLYTTYFYPMQLFPKNCENLPTGFGELKRWENGIEIRTAAIFPNLQVENVHLRIPSVIVKGD